MTDDLQHAIELLKSGKKTQAGVVFAKLVQADTNNEQAWIGLSACVVDENQRRDCLKQVLRINPLNEPAQKALAALEGRTGYAAERTSSARPNSATTGRSPYRTTVTVGAGLVAVVLVLVGLAWAWNRTGIEGLIGHPSGVAWNNLASIQQGGVTVEIARLAAYEKSSVSNEEQKAYQTNAFYGLNTICDLYFRITNSSDRIMSVYPDQGLLMVNNEQVQLSSWMFNTHGTTGGQLLPGATVIGTITFGLKDVTPDTIRSITFTFTSPHDEYFNSYGQDYLFNLDLSNHAWAARPDELK